MARKIRLPDEDITPVWSKMTPDERTWYEDFKKATEYHNWKILKELCDKAPSDQYEVLYAELSYESHAYERARYTVPTSRFPRYSETDYGWVPTKSINVRREIQYDYSGNTETTSGFSTTNDGAKTRRLRK